MRFYSQIACRSDGLDPLAQWRSAALCYFGTALRLVEGSEEMDMLNTGAVSLVHDLPCVDYVEDHIEDMFVFGYSVRRSNDYLSRFFWCYQFSLLTTLRKKLVLQGRGNRSLVIFSNFLLFAKIVYCVDPLLFLHETFFASYWLPFRVYTVRAANRTFSFPGPILSELEYENFFLKTFGKAFRSREEMGFLNKFFIELCLFLEHDADSRLVQVFDQIVAQGFENRAFLHYRWRHN